MDSITTNKRNIYTVSQLNQQANAILSSSFPLLWVKGEISNLARPSSGHLYFTLKDTGAQIRCAMFRQHRLRLYFQPENGMQVIIRARAGLYEIRGDFQLTVEHMEESGHGTLQLKFENLKRKLAEEGLFDQAHKRALPDFPRRLGIITSPTGAALHDILNVLQRRFPSIPVVIYPTLVQGEGAAANIIEMLNEAYTDTRCDLLIIARGGGSLEDLWPFNEESVARALAARSVPVISGIGHEIDFTICDFIADLRAPTPSAAAELATPDQDDLHNLLNKYSIALEQRFTQLLSKASQSLKWLEGRLNRQHPVSRMLQQSQRLDELDNRVRQALQWRLTGIASRLKYATSRFTYQTPSRRLEWFNTLLVQQRTRLVAVMEQQLQNKLTSIIQLKRALNAVSPNATLNRGYAIVTHYPDQSLIRRSSDTCAGDSVNIRLSSGKLIAEIKTTH